MEMMRGRCSIILALLLLAVSPSKGAIMEVGGVTECPAEGGMYNCRQMSVDFDALLAAEEVTIEGSGALVGLVFGRDITISRDQVYEGHMYTYTVSELASQKVSVIISHLLRSITWRNTRCENHKTLEPRF